MPKAIIKLTDDKTGTDYYLEWSTVVDAPVTYGMSLDEFREYYRDEYGAYGMQDLDQRLCRVEAARCSSQHYSLADLLAGNRAGEDESHLTMAELIDMYCVNAPPPAA